MAAEVVPYQDFESRVERQARQVAIADRAGHPSESYDPRAATRQLRFVSQGQPQKPDWKADNAFRYGLLANFVAARCVAILADTISALPFRAGPEIPDVGEVADTRPSSRLAQLLGPPPDGPNPSWSARLFWWWQITQYLTTGAMASEVELETGTKRVAALWPLVVANLDTIPSTGGTDWWAGFTYGPGHDKRRLSPDRVWYHWRPKGTDPREPYSPLEPAAYPLAIATMGDRQQHGFLANGGVPSFLVVTEQFASPQERHRFRSQWESRYKGPDNAGKTHFAEVSEGEGSVGDGVDVKVLGLSQRDAEFAEIHKAQLSYIAMSLGVPWSRLDASGRTFDNAEQEDRAFWTDTIIPLCRDLQDGVNMRLAPRLGSEMGWFDLSGIEVIKPKPKWNPAQGALLVRDEVITKNEQRAAIGLPPIEGGDEFPERTPEPPPEFSQLQAEVAEIREALPRPEPPAPIEAREIDSETIEARRFRLWSTANAIAETLESRWERAFGRFFERQAEATLKRLQGNRGRRMLDGLDLPPVAHPRQPDPHKRRHEVVAVQLRQSAEEIFQREFWETETAGMSQDLYEAVMTESFVRLSDKFGVSFDLEAEWAQDFIRSRANQLSGQVTQTTYDEITRALAKGVEKGEDIPSLASRVREVFTDASERRAIVISRTEVVSAFNGSASLGAATLPASIVGGQEWIATRDGRTRPAHARADGQITPVGQPFEVAGEGLMYPGDPVGRASNTVQCRCTVAFLTPDEVAELTEAAPLAVPVERAITALAMVSPGTFDETRMRRALEAA